MTKGAFHRAFSVVGLLVLLATAPGCFEFTHGKGDPTELAKLKPGSTTDYDLNLAFGKPYKERSVTVNNTIFEFRKYRLKSLFNDHRLLFTEFQNRILNGYCYLSTASDDRTVVDYSKLASVKLGASTRADIQRLFGAPSGKFLMPSAISELKPLEKNPFVKDAWAWQSAVPGDPGFQQEIIIVFDKADRVYGTLYFEGPLADPMQRTEIKLLPDVMPPAPKVRERT